MMDLPTSFQVASCLVNSAGLDPGPAQPGPAQYSTVQLQYCAVQEAFRPPKACDEKGSRQRGTGGL